MPKLKPSATEKRGEIIFAWKRFYNYSDEKAATLLGMSTSTLQNRRRKGGWSIEELHKAITAFKIPPMEALEMLTLGCYPMESYMEKERNRRK